ncbi:MAG: aminoglycoside phosphotransferase family protein [Trebonia sp.]
MGQVTPHPDVLARQARRWSLEIGDPVEPGQTAQVAPARGREFGDVVLKVARQHAEGRDEAAGLREWDGDGAVRLYRAEDVDAGEDDEATTALLLERCVPGHALSREPGAVQDEVIAGRLRRLWKEPPFAAAFRPLQEMCDQWTDECERKLARLAGAADPGLLRDGIALFRSLPGTASREVLLCTDLHAGNVLSAQREPWLVIDPKPYVGDPAYDVLQHMLNCEDRLFTDPAGLIARLAGLLGLDRDRVTQWLFARCVVEAPDWPDLLGVARRLGSRAA